MDIQVSEEIPMLGGVRQGDQMSPTSFTATIQEVFKYPTRRERNKYRWRKSVGPKIC